MNRSLILSNLRIEARRKQAGFVTERAMLNWVQMFLDDMSIAHASQIREWQKELFLANLQNKGEISYEELLQARSALVFLFEKVLKPSSGYVQPADDHEAEPGIFKITA
jgi:hypothetical protein